MLQLVVLKLQYRHELAITAVYDVLDVPRDQVIQNIANTLIVFRCAWRRWERGQFLPREIQSHCVDGERIDLYFCQDFSPAAWLALQKWNARKLPMAVA